MKTKSNCCRLVLLFILFALPSCKENDDVSMSDIVGTWRLIAEEGYEKKNGEIIDQWSENCSEVGHVWGLGFKKDGMAFDYHDEDMEENDVMKWTLKGREITLVYRLDNGSYYEEEPTLMKILHLDSSKLVIEEKIIEERNSKGEIIRYEMYDKMTLKKIE